MSDRKTDEIGSGDAAQSREAADQLRRRLLKTGAAAVPVIISLQSGTAWALSSCASAKETGVKRPTRSQLVQEFGDFSSDPNSTQLANRQTVQALTGIKAKKGGKNNYNDIESIVNNFTGSGGGYPYPEGPGESVETGDMIHLMVTNGSCWTSYCTGPIRNTRDVYIYSDTNPSVCGS
ncbi:MAG: hypothetical protein GC201_16080 [Alphaproteobacteria bacterium]|nr:hypothetical protein [Alphaproteobacteria bacterium]